MTDTSPVVIYGAVEGPTDEAVLRRLTQYVGASLSDEVYGKRGKAHLQQKLQGYNQAAHWAPWVVLVDLDDDADCAPAFAASWLPDPAPNICFRIAVRAVEAWLLADRERMARFLSISESVIPTSPDDLPSPKQTMVNLARRSRRRAIRDGMVPRQNSGRTVGDIYTLLLIEFVEDTTNGWRPDVAAASADSLSRSLRCIQQLANASK